MKTSLTLLSALIISTSTLFAQSLMLSNANGTIANGQIIMESGDANFVITTYVFVTNNTSSDLNVMVKKVDVEIVPNTTNYFCWIQCYPPEVYESPSPLLIPAHSTDNTHFSGDYDAMGIYGISKIKYVFFVDQNPNDSACVEVWFNAGTVGLNPVTTGTVQLSDASPNPANDMVTFNYTLPENANHASLVINDLLGNKVREISPQGRQGKMKIDISDLKSGLYLYSFYVDNRQVLSKKLIVR